MTNERVYVLVAIDKESIGPGRASMVAAVLAGCFFIDQFAVADVTDLVTETAVSDEPVWLSAEAAYGWGCGYTRVISEMLGKLS